MLLVTLFAAQTVAAAAGGCEDPQQRLADDACACCDGAVQNDRHDCGCYHGSTDPATRPAPDVQSPPLTAISLPTATFPARPKPQRLTVEETLPVPASPSLRACHVRAPPILW